jgi:hypothetical protein
MEYTRDLGTPIPIMKVIVYYAGGSTLSATTPEEWAELPEDSVQILQVLYRRLYKRKYLQDVIAGENYYWYYAGHYYGGNASQIPQEAQHIKTGSWVSDEQYLKLYNEALSGVVA